MQIGMILEKVYNLTELVQRNMDLSSKDFELIKNFNLKLEITNKTVEEKLKLQSEQNKKSLKENLALPTENLTSSRVVLESKYSSLS